MSEERRSDRLPPRIGPNLILRFVLELFALVSIVVGTLAVRSDMWGWSFGLWFAFLAAVAWGAFRSPRARWRLPLPGRLLVEAIVMGAGVVGWVLSHQPVVAAVFGVVALVSGALNARAEYRAEHPRGEPATD